MSLRFRRFLNSFFAFLLLAISPGALAQTAPDLVGFWWKPTESGWGLAIQQQGNSTFAVWFTYDPQGAAIWYTLSCTFSGSSCAGDLYTGSGTPFLRITGSANAVVSKVGTGSIVVTSTNRLSLGYTIGSITQNKTNLEPQNLVPADQVPVCKLLTPNLANARAGETNYTDLWWGGQSASGWGMQISHQGNTVFAGWYSYNAKGTATWLTAQGTRDRNNTRRFTGSLYIVNPGIAFSTINGPVPPSSVISSGSFELNFSDGERGTFTWTMHPEPGAGLQTGTLPIERFAIAGGALNVCTFDLSGIVNGRVVTSQDAASPVAGARIVDGQTKAVLAITDAAGNFQINVSSTSGAPSLNVSISAEGYLTRETGLLPGTQGVVADIIKLSPPFSLKYYRELVRSSSNGDLNPGGGLVGWRAGTMNVYIRTNLLDPTDLSRAPRDTGVAVSPQVVNRVLNGLEKTVAELAGGTIQIGRVESGPELAHNNEPGWLAIDFFDRENHPQNYSGFAGTNANGYAFARLGVHASASFDCAPISQGLAMHELGHVFGLSHAQLDSPNLMLGGGINMPCADTHFSPAERLHGRIAFSRPRGNEDPDRDPVGFVLPGVRR